MKILFKNDGSIKTTELDTYINQHSHNANYINFAIADLDNTEYTSDCVFVLPNNEEVVLQPNLKTFSINNTEYLGYQIYLTEETTALSGTLKFIVRAYQNGSVVMYSTPISLTINATSRNTSTIEISTAEYNSMLSKFGNYITKYDNSLVYKYETLAQAEKDANLNNGSRIVVGVSDFKIYKKQDNAFNELKDANLTDYYTKTAIESIFADYYTCDEIDSKLSDIDLYVNSYKLVEANPNGDATLDLQTIKIGDTIYDLPTFMPYITLSATSGTLTTSQLFTLQANDSSYILLNGAKFYLCEKTTTTLKYSHLENPVISQIVVDVATKEYTYTNIEFEIKTLFGQYSIIAPKNDYGNYDLFRYTLKITNDTDTYMFTYVSSVSIDIDSLTDLKTLLYVDSESKYIVGTNISDNSCVSLCVASGAFTIGKTDISSYTITCEKETI